MYIVLVGCLSGAGGLVLGYCLRWLLGKYQATSIEKQALAVRGEAEREAKAHLKEAEIQARADVIKAREEFESSTKARRAELTQVEERLGVREEALDKKMSLIDRKEENLEERLTQLQQRTEQVQVREGEVEKKSKLETERLQRLAGMTHDEARRELLSRMETDVHGEMGGLIRRLHEEAQEEAERNARSVVTTAIQRYAVTHACEMMTSTVPLPSDDIKGRIIGREGRNIRALESETGVNMLIDDTPEAVVISGFDPIRREIARSALEKLVADGRIHPARIEEVVQKTRDEMEETIREAGSEALFSCNILAADPELVRRLGRLKFRTSYSQNVLQHSMEVAQLMSVMAGELGLDPSIARRIGVFHDIGKALDHEVEGGHAIIGADLLRRCGESKVVVNAVAAHHEEVAAESLYAVLCSAADAISSSRPGARSETTNVYVQRLERLEEIANGFSGVKKTYAIQAGREIRVVVEPGKIDDNHAAIMARDISKKIERDLHYPGQIRVVVIRERRCVEYAR